jgi:hypothetical protein
VAGCPPLGDPHRLRTSKPSEDGRRRGSQRGTTCAVIPSPRCQAGQQLGPCDRPGPASGRRVRVKRCDSSSLALGLSAAGCSTPATDVVMIARGAHYQALSATGLRLESPDAAVTLVVAVVPTPSDLVFRDDDVAVLAVKSQDTARALQALSSVASADLPLMPTVMPTRVISDISVRCRRPTPYAGCPSNGVMPSECLYRDELWA